MEEKLDNNTLKKKLSTYLTESGRFRNVSNEVLFELLNAWEEWPGTACEFYRSIGCSHRQMAKLVGKAKKLKREGTFPESEFREILPEDGAPPLETKSSEIEISWGNDKVIRFRQIDSLVEFLKKVA